MNESRKDYDVIYILNGFHEHNIVYGVKSRAEAIQTVKDHYGSKNVKVISAKQRKI